MERALHYIEKHGHYIAQLLPPKEGLFPLLESELVLSPALTSSMRQKWSYASFRAQTSWHLEAFACQNVPLKPPHEEGGLSYWRMRGHVENRGPQPNSPHQLPAMWARPSRNLHTSEASTTSRETASESGETTNSFRPLSFEIVCYTEIDSRDHYYHYQQPPSFI